MFSSPGVSSYDGKSSCGCLEVVFLCSAILVYAPQAPKNRGSVLISGLCFEPRESVLYLKCECFIKNSAATTSLDQRLRSQRRVVDGMVQDVCVIDICTADSKGRPLLKKIRSKFSVTILRNFRYLSDNNSNLFRMKANYLCFSDKNYLFLSITIFDSSPVH